MNAQVVVDYGPLTQLIGVWKGDKGLDVAPTKEGDNKISYHETISFSAIGDVTNASTQTLSVLHYRQIVQRKEDDEVFHDETGYWMWDPDAKIVMHSLQIPRAVCVLAGGLYTGEQDTKEQVVIEVSANCEGPDWKIIQSPFMEKNAKTTEFKQTLKISENELLFSETTMLDIYGKTFTHTDENILTLQ